MYEKLEPNRREFLKQLGGLAGVAVASRFLLGSNLANANMQKEATELPPVHPEFHQRLEHPKEGAIHVWHPEYSGELEDIVIFGHGTDGDADKVWEEMDLKGQFKESKRPSLFIVPSFAKDGYDRLKWKSLPELINYVKSETGKKSGDSVTMIPHSHHYRTARHYLDYVHLDTIILSDPLYEHRDVNNYVEWVHQDGKMLVMIAPPKEKYSKSTERNMERIITRSKKWHGEDALIIKGVPEQFDDELIQNPPKLVHIISQYSHGQIPRSRKVYPVVLKLTNR